jgi:hypothetical protein
MRTRKLFELGVGCAGFVLVLAGCAQPQVVALPEPSPSASATATSPDPAITATCTAIEGALTVLHNARGRLHDGTFTEAEYSAAVAMAGLIFELQGVFPVEERGLRAETQDMVRALGLAAESSAGLPGLEDSPEFRQARTAFSMACDLNQSTIHVLSETGG